MIVKRALILILIALHALLANAKMDFPPVFESEMEVRNYAFKIASLLPETKIPRQYSADVLSVVKWEQMLLKVLLDDPSWVAATKKREALQLFRVRYIVKHQVKELEPNTRWKELLDQAPDLDATAAYKEFEQLVRSWREVNSQRFFSGWASLFPSEVRDILREPDLNLRWRNLKSFLKTASPLIISRFKAEIFGASQRDWTLDDLDDVVKKLNDVETRILLLLYQLNHGQTFEKRFSLPDSYSYLSKHMNSLVSRALRLYSEVAKVTEEQELVYDFVLREVPPTLAIHRGAVGKDCSSLYSFAFPYSPFERVWWVESPEGQRYGYVSGNITLVNGTPNLYISDVQVPSLPGGQAIEFILKAFYMIKSHYGATQMTIMHEDFTYQNHIPFHRKFLVEAKGAHRTYVRQSYQDSGWRGGVLKEFSQKAAQRFDVNYDSAERHELVRQVFYPGSELEGLEVERKILDSQSCENLLAAS